MAIVAPETALRQALIDELTTEFAAEGFEFKDDKLHGAIKLEPGQAVGGVYPERAAARPNQTIVQETYVIVQLFGYWKREISPETVASPTQVEEWAERIRRRTHLAQANTPGQANRWFYEVQEVRYPPDPTGNITRLSATVRAFSDNTAVVETVM